MTRVKNAMEILRASLMLGLTSFGGPAAHIGYFREEYVMIHINDDTCIQ